jgi:hypothetical protein
LLGLINMTTKRPRSIKCTIDWCVRCHDHTVVVHIGICVCFGKCYVFMCVCEYGMSAMYVVWRYVFARHRTLFVNSYHTWLVGNSLRIASPKNKFKPPNPTIPFKLELKSTHYVSLRRGPLTLHAKTSLLVAWKFYS